MHLHITGSVTLSLISVRGVRGSMHLLVPFIFLQAVDNPTYTSFEQLDDRIRQLSKEYGIEVVGQSVRGFTPSEAYDLAEAALLRGDVEPWKDIRQRFM